MDGVDEVPIRILHVLEADISEDAGIVKEDVDAAEGVDGRFDDLVAILDAVIVRDCLAAGSFDLFDDNVGGLEQRQKVTQVDEACDNARRTFVPAPSPLKEPPRSFTTTLAPLEAKKRAYAFPRPPPAPVTTTVWLSKRNSCTIVTCLLVAHAETEEGLNSLSRSGMRKRYMEEMQQRYNATAGTTTGSEVAEE